MRYNGIPINHRTLAWHIDRRRYLQELHAEKEAQRHTYKRAKQFIWRDEAFFADQEQKRNYEST